MTDQTPDAPEAGKSDDRLIGDRQVSLKKVLAVVGVSVVLGATFYAGMAYENHRIVSGIEDAFSGFDEDSEGDDGDESDEEEATKEAVEIVEGEPLVVDLGDQDFDDESDGELTITLEKSSIGAASETYEEQPDLTRNLVYYLKVQNTGDQIASASLEGHFESEDGEVFDFAGVFCDDEIPSDDIKPGQFVSGCSTSDIPASAGKFVFDNYPTPFYIEVKAG